MGDIADYIIDEALWGIPRGLRRSSGRTYCKKCGENSLYWRNRNGKWILCDSSGDRHSCDMQAAADEDFEAIK